MKLFDLDWLDFIERSCVWENLTQGTRRIFVQLKPNNAVLAKDFGGDLQLLTDAGFVTMYVDGVRAKLHKSCTPFARAIRAMWRHDILGQPDAAMMQNYIADHLTRVEQDALLPDRQRYYSNASDLVRGAMSVAWMEDLLSLKNLKQAQTWEELRRQPEQYYGRRNSEPTFFSSGKMLAATQTVIKQFMASTGPVAFADLSAQFKKMPLPLLANAVYAGIRYLLFFPSIRHDDLTPMINIWPTIQQHLHRPKAKSPRAVIPDQTFHCAYLMEDMTTVLVGASGEPPRVRSSDFALFAKAQQQIESNLTPVPDWLGQMEQFAVHERVQTTVKFLQGFQFLGFQGTQGKDFRLEPTAEAREWLGLPSKERLKTILDRLKPGPSKASKQKNARDLARREAIFSGLGAEDDDDFYDDYDDIGFISYDHDGYVGFLPQTAKLVVESDSGLDISAALIDAYRTLARRRFVRLSDFLEYHAQQANPLLKRCSGTEPLKLRIGWSWRTPTEEEAESLWVRVLIDFFRLRLLPLGGAEVGLVGASKDVCIALSGSGRYLLDLARDFDYDQSDAQQGHIVVQPNFDIVFLSPSPLAEATIARFADRMANGTGTLFKITKNSTFAAASCNMTADQMLDTLQGLCAKAIPTNVTREVRDWFGQCGRVAIKSTFLIRCPDAQIATRVLSVGGKKLTPISDTVIELADHNFKAPLVKKLEKAGVFVDLSSTAAAVIPKRRARRQPW